jgi:cephalosporin-C deacetylase-like acetyl esterase
MASLKSQPEVFDSPEIHSSDPRIRALFFEGAPYRGKPTRIFAWVGIPVTKPGGKVPGIVLLHGGGGTAFESWVKAWVDRGYAAIAIDHFGSLPVPENANPRPRNPAGGPPGGSATFSQLGEPLRDQWPLQAITAAMRAHSLLLAQPEVDPDRTGVTGISWGGYLTCLMAALHNFPHNAEIVKYICGVIRDLALGSASYKTQFGNAGGNEAEAEHQAGSQGGDEVQRVPHGISLPARGEPRTRWQNPPP